MTSLSVIIPFRNRANLLRKTLESISAQEGLENKSIELILVDNDSNQETVRMVRKWIEDYGDKLFWANIKLIVEKKIGASIARNTGFRYSASPWIAFFDSDDLMKKNHLGEIISNIQRFPDCDIIYRDVEYHYDGKTRVLRGTRCNLWHDVILHSILTTPRHVVTREFFQRSGLWNEELPAWNDWELSIRYLINDPKIKHISGVPTMTIISHEDSITGHQRNSLTDKLTHAISVARKELMSSPHCHKSYLLDIKEVFLACQYKKDYKSQKSNEIMDRIIKNSVVKPWFLKMIYRVQSNSRGYGSLIVLLSGLLNGSLFARKVQNS